MAKKETRQLTLKQAIAIARRKTGDDDIIAALTGRASEIPVIPTGNFLIDWVTGIGGVPLSSILEVYGPPLCGKSTLAMQIAANAQRMEGGRVLYLDYEHAFPIDYAKALGVDVDQDTFMLSQPSSLEDGFDITEVFVSNRLVNLVIVDSLAAMVTREELEGKVGKRFMAPQARAMAMCLKRIVGIVDRSQCCLIFINHVRDVIETGFAATLGLQRKTTPGGQALKFYSHVRLSLRKVKSIRGKIEDPVSGDRVDQVMAQLIGVEVVKNKKAPPFSKCNVYLTLDKGFSETMSLLDIGITRGIIQKDGARIVFPSELLGQTAHVSGTGKALEALEKRQDLRLAVQSRIEALLYPEADVEDHGVVGPDVEEPDVEEPDDVEELEDEEEEPDDEEVS